VNRALLLLVACGSPDRVPTATGSNEAHAIHRKTGKHELVVSHSPHRIVGAGVSTCAPLLEKPL